MNVSSARHSLLSAGQLDAGTPVMINVSK